MIPELGHLALWLALGVAAVLGVVPLAGAQKGRTDWMVLARPLTAALFAFIAFAFANHDCAIHGQFVEGGTHCLHRGSIGGLFVAATNHL